MMHQIAKILLATVVVLATGVGLYIRFTHPTYTETQLFLAFWPVWVAVVVSLGAAVWVYRRTY